ncbi:rho-related protein racB-like [Physella acuta]|uniref:rho-related protein racB-like n=1 Tax=Physella acuta TaxID=109671 RepID=UPI0027DE7268|nr:rho-related protein racB-like [Physella acuta]XP_059154307.1 rho-related protein racB-like [Physella acuta]XP_059154308.1 rho-related protein racB-like [Physella acuta]
MEYLCCWTFSKGVAVNDLSPHYRMVVVGDLWSGKTSLIYRFTRGTLPGDDTQTVFDTDEVQIPIDNKKVYLTIRDTSGTEEDARIRALAYDSCDVILICFSVASPQSLHNVVSEWASEVHHLCKNVPYLLVGTHADLRDNSKLKRAEKEVKFISNKKGEQTAKMIGAKGYFEFSALDERNAVKKSKFIFGRAVREVMKIRKTFGS